MKINHELSLLNHPVIGQRYFFPRHEPPGNPFWVNCNGVQLACVYSKSNPEWPTVVHFHGNGEVVADYLDGFPQRLQQVEYNCFLAEFRGYGGSSGVPELGSMLCDVHPTIEAIGVPEEQLVLFGRSVGSLFAIKAAELFPNVRGLILESAVADPMERLLLRLYPEELGTTSLELAEAINKVIDIKGIMSEFSRPTLILHTRHDGLIDVNHAERLAGWCNGPTTLKVFPMGSHNDIMFVNAKEYFEQVNKFLSSLQG
jgi:pimeloyl-ACP methyl ester carboxylesterase